MAEESEPTLFDLEKHTHRKGGVPMPDWFHLGNNTPLIHTRRVARGLHPTGHELGPRDSKCSGCKFKRGRHMAKRYWKCDMTRPWTGGAVTDIKLKWQGCQHWESG